MSEFAYQNAKTDVDNPMRATSLVPFSSETESASFEFSPIYNNAAKYTADAGHIRLSIQTTVDSTIVEVENYSIDIDPALLPHIFDLFTQGA
jgi:hypothetical protein